MTITITLGQIHIQSADVAANLDHVKSIAKGLPTGSLLLLPELWTSSYELEKTADIVKDDGPALQELAGTARSAGIYIGGSLLEEIDGAVYNSFNLITPQGETAAKYRKIHLFKPMDEHKWMKAGNKPVITQVADTLTGLAICYDLRFPELFRYYGTHGCKLILLSAEWPVRRLSHWRILLQARAVENQCFIAAVGNAGETNGAKYGGTSLLIDPWGNILAEGSAIEEDIITAEIDLSVADHFRQRIPALEDRRPDVYAAWQD